MPVHIRFHGEPQNDYEASAWFYGDGQWPSEVWDGSRFRRTSYQPLPLNITGDWDGSYLIILVRNASDTDDRT